MTISYYDGRAEDETDLVLALMITNAAFVLLVVLGWPILADPLGVPMEWAMGFGAGPSLSLQEYPYAILWALPLLGCIVAWVAMRCQFWLLAKVASRSPALILGLMFAWYYLAPMGWR